MAAFLLCTVCNAQLVERIDEKIARNLQQHEGLYQHFHQYPELSFKEFKTSEKLSGELERLGFKVTRNVGGNAQEGSPNRG